MADLKISQLTAITTLTPATDVLPVVDVTGTTKKITTNQILGSGGTATLASATITGDLTVDTSTLKVDSTNNRVGINTASPSFTADIAGVANSAPITLLRLNNTGTTSGGPGIASRLQFNAGSTNLGFIQGCNFASGAIGVQISGDGTNIHSTLDSSGNLGLGVTPSAWGSNFRSLEVGTYTGLAQSVSGYSRLANNAYNNNTNWIYRNTAASTLYEAGGGIHAWFNAPSGTANTTTITNGVSYTIITSGNQTAFGAANNNVGTVFTATSGGTLSSGTVSQTITFTQAMTLDASGNLLVGKTASSTTVAGAQVQPDGTFSSVKGDTNPGFFYNRSTAASGTIALFRSNSVTVGSITQDGTNTSYVTTSDYRLKENVQPLVGGLARISALKPSIYKWKSNGSAGEGFLAHELAEMIPAAVTGQKDAVNADGTINAQGVDLSKVVPVLVAAIQELAAEVNALKNA